jgi:hypothetical protein
MKYGGLNLALSPTRMLCNVSKAASVRHATVPKAQIDCKELGFTDPSDVQLNLHETGGEND